MQIQGEDFKNEIGGKMIDIWNKVKSNILKFFSFGFRVP